MSQPTHGLTRCRKCAGQVSFQATSCPHCGAPHPAEPRWDGWGVEYRSQAELLGIPLLHVAFKYRRGGMPVVARGVIAIGQFAVGIVSIAQFGVGVLSLSQFTIAGLAVAQIGIAWSLIAQVGLYVDQGWGQVVYRLGDLLGTGQIVQPSV